MSKHIKIAPSILSADFTKLGEQITALEQAGANSFHIDIMDGNFVPNLSFGPMIVKQLRPLTKLPLDVHLMVLNPQNYIKQLVDAGADIITFHYEACIHHDRLIEEIKDYKKKVGIALNPSTCETVLEYIYNKLDLILVMTVNPGFGGQHFLASQIKKIENIAKQYITHDMDLQIDGGVDFNNAPQLKACGATSLVAGTSIFSNLQYKQNIDKLKEKE